jgi:tRNA threonylcarbamoyladenosine biosynthesis protein TsaE
VTSDSVRPEPVEERTTTEAETVAVGRALGATLAPRSTVLLYGDLGAGKTAFVRGLAEGLGLDPGAISSPTFTIVQEHRRSGLTLQHVDLYRLSGAEIVDLALDDLLGPETVMAIEWAEKLPDPPEPPVVTVRLAHVPEGRRISIDQSPS